MSTIVLLDHEQMHLGFVLVAGLPTGFQSTVGRWEADCIFMGPPTEVRLIEEPAFRVISEHHVQGEHRVTVTNDGVTVALEACSSQGAILYLTIPIAGVGAWGTQNGTTKTQYGHAHFIPPNAARLP